MEYVPGMLARSLAGHDYNKVYVILKADAECVYLADGKIRTVERLKKKKKKHVQLIGKIPAELEEKLSGGCAVRNEEIRRAIGGSAHV